MTFKAALRLVCALHAIFFGLGTIWMIVRSEDPQLIAVSAGSAFLSGVVSFALFLCRGKHD